MKEYECYELTQNGQSAPALVLARIGTHEVILMLYNDLGLFKYGDTVKLNLDTLDIETYIYDVKETA